MFCGPDPDFFLFFFSPFPTSFFLKKLRSSYYREMRKFIGIPNSFTGFGNKDVYVQMADRNAKSLIQVYVKAEELFQKLFDQQESLKDWVALGKVSDIFQFVEDHCTTVKQWETNFDVLKKRRKNLDKMPDFYKIDCFSVSATPLKAAIEDQIQSFGDALVLSLRKSVTSSLARIETFLSSSMELLGVLPNTIEEIGHAKKEWKVCIYLFFFVLSYMKIDSSLVVSLDFFFFSPCFRHE